MSLQRNTCYDFHWLMNDSEAAGTEGEDCCVRIKTKVPPQHHVHVFADVCSSRSCSRDMYRLKLISTIIARS